MHNSCQGIFSHFLHMQRSPDIKTCAQALKAASKSSDAFERISKQIDSMESIATAFPLTDPQVSNQGAATAFGTIQAFHASASLSFRLKVKHLMAHGCLL